VSEQNPPTEMSSPPPQSFGSMPASEGGPSVPGQPTYGAPPVFDEPPSSAEPTLGSPPPAPPEPMPAADAASVPPGDTTGAPAKKRRGGLWGYLVLAVVIIAIVAFYYTSTRDDASKAQVGQCLGGTTTTERNADHMKIVDCASSDANFKVVKRVEGKLYGESDAACNDEPSTSYVFWSGKDNEKGTVLCLSAVAK
jgi:hypothetical protein